MFSGCTSLTTAPKLPATTLASYCYYRMFSDCTSLTTAPEIPATTSNSYCCGYMFLNCTSLTSAPLIAATALTNYCYQYMFSGCSSLNYIKCLASSGITNTGSLTNWVNGVAPSGTFVKSPNATTGSTGTSTRWAYPSVNGIPNGWTIENAS